MAGRVQGKRVLVTGAASGIGRASAILLAREGARLALVDSDAQGLERVASKIGDAAISIKADVTLPEDWARAMAVVERRLAVLDALVHVAGISVMKPFDQTTLEDWRRIHAVNLDAIFIGTQAALPLLRLSAGASIVMVSSSSGLQSKPNLTAYCSSKGAVRLFGRALARELAPANIRCNVVFPGTVDTPMVRRSFGVENAPDAVAQMLARVSGIPLGRVGEAEDIGWMIVYLASDESKYVTGAEMVVDGGRTS